MLEKYFPALKSRAFTIFFIGQFISLIGTWMQSTVQPYLAYRITSQPFYLGLIGFAGTLPTMLFVLPGGVVIEHLDKRKTVIVMQIVMTFQAFILAALTLTGTITIWHIVILAFILGTANCFEMTARQSMLIELVDRDTLPNAIALNSSLFNAARVIGPALSVPFLIILKDAGEGWAFFANGISYLVVIISLLSVRTKSHTVTTTGPRFSIKQMLEGMQYIRQEKTILTLISMVAVLSFFGVPFAQQIPVFAKQVISSPLDSADVVATRNSLLISCQGMGALIASVYLAVSSRNRNKGRILTMGQFAFSIALIGISLSAKADLTYGLMALAGWGLVSQLALTNTLIQQKIPDNLRGRVISTYFWVLQGATPFGSLLIGVIAQYFGAPGAVLFSGCICFLLYTIIHLKNPFIRHLKM